MTFIFRLSILVTCVIVIPFHVHGIEIGTPWSTSFEYPQSCVHNRAADGGSTSCAAVQNDAVDWVFAGGSTNPPSQVLSAANYPFGMGGMGARFWVGDGHNQNSAPAVLTFSEPKKELWIRWYMRYQKGFQWKDNSIHYNKVLYIRTQCSHNAAIPSLLTNDFSMETQDSYQAAQRFGGAGWNGTYGPGPSNGEWHCFEVHMKMDSAGIHGGGFRTPDVQPFNGVARMWLNGRLVGEKTNVNYSNGYADARQGWFRILFNHNQNEVDNRNGPIGQSWGYVDFDDMVVYTEKPPNVDAHGNPFIGPVGAGGGKPSPPVEEPEKPIDPPSNFRLIGN